MRQYESIAQAEYAAAASLTAASASAPRFVHVACDDQNFASRVHRNVTHLLEKFAGQTKGDLAIRENATKARTSESRRGATPRLDMESFLAPKRDSPKKAYVNPPEPFVVQGLSALEWQHSTLAQQIRGGFLGAIDLLGEARCTLTRKSGIPLEAIAEFFNIKGRDVEREVLPVLEPHFAKLTCELFDLLHEADKRVSTNFNPAFNDFYVNAFPEQGQLQFHALVYPELTPAARAHAVLHESVHLAVRGRDLFYLPALQQRGYTPGEGSAGWQAMMDHAFLMRPENHQNLSQRVSTGGVGEERFSWIWEAGGRLPLEAGIEQFHNRPEARIKLLLHNPDSVVALALILAGRAGRSKSADNQVASNGGGLQPSVY